jgi:hypothetical protein
MSGDEDEKSIKLKNKPRYLFAESPAESTYKKAHGDDSRTFTNLRTKSYKVLFKMHEIITRQMHCSVLSVFVIQCEIHSGH